MLQPLRNGYVGYWQRFFDEDLIDEETASGVVKRPHGVVRRASVRVKRLIVVVVAAGAIVLCLIALYGIGAL